MGRGVGQILTSAYVRRGIINGRRRRRKELRTLIIGLHNT